MEGGYFIYIEKKKNIYKNNIIINFLLEINI